MLSPLLFISCFANYSCVHGIATTDRSLDHDVPGKVVIKANPEKFHPAIDIRGVRKIYNVGHWENADHLTTQLNVLLRTLADHIEAKNGEATSPKVFPEYCSAGVHRCDGAAKCTACQVLNKVSSVGGGGRLCGAEVFSCSNVGPNRLAKTVFEEATKWTRWTVARGKNWASAASDASSRAYKQLEWINGLARLMSGVGAASLDVFTRGPLVDDLSASSCEKDVTFVAADETGRSSQNDMCAAPKTRPKVPRPPRDALPKAKRQRTHSPSLRAAVMGGVDSATQSEHKHRVSSIALLYAQRSWEGWTRLLRVTGICFTRQTLRLYLHYHPQQKLPMLSRKQVAQGLPTCQKEAQRISRVST